MGGGTPRANAPIALRTDRLAPIARAASFPSFLCPLPSFLRRQEPTTKNTILFPNSSLPPSRGEVRWGVERREPTRQSRCAPIAWHRSPALPLFRRSCVSSPSFLRRQEPRRTTTLRPSPARRRSNVAWAARRNVAARSGAGARLASCLRRNDGEGAWGWSGGRAARLVRRSRTPTPHLTSPLEGGRDELGKGWVLGWLVPACAGMTEEGERV